MTDRNTLTNLSYLPALPLDADVRAKAAALVELAFAKLDRMLRSRRTKDGDRIRAIRLVLEYAAGRPAQTVTVKGDASRILEQLDNAALARIVNGDIDGAALLTMLPPPRAIERDEPGEV